MATFSVQGPHPTSGLSGYPARDYMAPGSTPVYAWGALRVKQISGGSGSRGTGYGGFNVYLVDAAGRNYFVTHVENLRAKVGDVLRPGQQFASVGTYKGMSTHVHIGYQGGDPVNVLGLKPEYVFTPGGAVAGSKIVAEATSRSSSSSGGLGWKGYLPGAGWLWGEGSIPDTGISDRPIGGVVDVVTAPADAIRWVAGNWDRMLEVAGGALLVLVGLALMGRSLGVTKTKVEVVEKAGAFMGAREYARAGSPPPATREDLRQSTTHEASDEGERRAARKAAKSRSSGYDPSTAEIPY